MKACANFMDLVLNGPSFIGRSYWHPGKSKAGEIKPPNLTFVTADDSSVIER